MAYYHCRSAATRSDAAVSNLVDRPMDLTIGGSTRKSDAQQRVGFAISRPIDGGSPSTATFTLGGAKPAYGSEVRFTFGGVLFWGGTVMEVRAVLLGPSLVQWDVQAVDYTWLLNRYARVNARYRNLSVNTIVHRILSDFTDANSGFRGGYLPSSLGSISEITFEDETVTGALSKLAKAANNSGGAYWRIRADKRIDMGTSFPDGVSLTLVNGSNVRELRYEESMSSIRTRTMVKARGSKTTSLTAVGSTTVSIEDCERFLTGGGTARHGWDTFTYTDTSAKSGPGSLTGVSGISDDIPQGATIHPLVQDDDSSAQTSLATTLGSSQSGVAVNVLSAEHLGPTEAADLAATDVDTFKAAVPALQYTIIGTSAVVRNQWPGAVITANVTAPLTIAGDFRIQNVTVSNWGVLNAGSSPLLAADDTIQAVVTARQIKRPDLFDLLGVKG